MNEEQINKIAGGFRGAGKTMSLVNEILSPAEHNTISEMNYLKKIIKDMSEEQRSNKKVLKILAYNIKRILAFDELICNNKKKLQYQHKDKLKLIKIWQKYLGSLSKEINKRKKEITERIKKYCESKKKYEIIIAIKHGRDIS